MAVISQNEGIGMSQGIFYYKKEIKENNYFFHDCNTEEGNSGSPIILINNLSVIGIHKGYDKKENKNIGIYLGQIIKFIETNDYIEKNEIKYIIKKDEGENKDDIIILNNNDNNIDEFIDNLNVYIKRQKIDVKIEGI